MGDSHKVSWIGRRLTARTPAALVALGAAVAVLAASSPVGSAGPNDTWSPSPSASYRQQDGTLVAGTLLVGRILDALAAAEASPSPSQSAGPTMKAIAVVTSPPGPKAIGPDPSRPLAVQPRTWLALKASGMVALVDGQVITLAAGTNPMIVPATGSPVPQSRLLDVSWTRWVVEVLGVGHDETGTYYRDLSYWELCGEGAMTVTLWYWQQLTGHPDVTGTAGYFLDPFVAQGAYWPKSGPRVDLDGRTRLGTYWSGMDTLNGYLATGRGFEMYLATQAHPPTWTSAGLAVFAKGGRPVYPSTGTDRATIQMGLNWEVSDHDADTWTTAYYSSVVGSDPYLAHDLNSAVMLDVGRDGVPVVASVDSFYLPNWANGAATQHAPHSITIVGYDNTSNPPTYTYTDTCGHACNPRTANREGRVYVIPQSRLALAMRYLPGAGFVW